MKKRCSACNETKAAAEFSPDKSKVDGLKAQCRECRAAVARARRGGSTPAPPRRLAAVPPAPPDAEPAATPGPAATGLECTLAALDVRPTHYALVEVARSLAATIDGLSSAEVGGRLPALATQLRGALATLSEVARPTSAPPQTEAEKTLARLRENSDLRRARWMAADAAKINESTTNDEETS